jgi:hypothetical protein
MSKVSFSTPGTTDVTVLDAELFERNGRRLRYPVDDPVSRGPTPGLELSLWIARSSPATPPRTEITVRPARPGSSRETTFTREGPQPTPPREQTPPGAVVGSEAKRSDIPARLRTETVAVASAGSRCGRPPTRSGRLSSPVGFAELSCSRPGFRSGGCSSVARAGRDRPCCPRR